MPTLSEVAAGAAECVKKYDSERFSTLFDRVLNAGIIDSVLKERQKSILDAAINEFIRTARPVASRDLVNKFRFEVSPATIRNEMLELDELGYLEQPHTSAGRTPTDLGYRFFVDNLTASAFLSPREMKLIDDIFSIRDESEFLRGFAKIISRISNTFTAIGAAKDDIFYESGLAEITNQPEFQNTESMKNFSRLADSLWEELNAAFGDLDKIEEKIFIGSENPLPCARSYTMTVSSWRHPSGFRGFFTMVGPKRTNYKKQKAVIENIKNRKNGKR